MTDYGKLMQFVKEHADKITVVENTPTHVRFTEHLEDGDWKTEEQFNIKGKMIGKHVTPPAWYWEALHMPVIH